MRITRIDFEGQPGNYATAVRRRLSDWIEVTILTPDTPNGREHSAAADCEEDIRSMAEFLQYHLEGPQKDEATTDAYYDELRKLSDC